MSVYQSQFQVGEFTAGYFFTIEDGKPKCIGFVVLDAKGNVLKSDFASLDDAISWAKLECEKEENLKMCNKVADFLEEAIQREDKRKFVEHSVSKSSNKDKGPK